MLFLASWAWARDRAHEPWRNFIRRTAGEHAVLLVLLAALGVQFADAHGVTTDGVIYFSQLRSALFDRDLDVAAEFAFLGQPPRPSHVVPIGPTFVWLPLYLAVAAVDITGRTLGWWSAPSDPVAAGLTLPYIRAALVSSFAIGAVGLFVIYRRLCAEFSTAVALAGTLLVFLATPLVWYMVYEPSMTHAASFGFVALFVVLAERYTAIDIAPRHAMVLGLLLGLAFMTRPQEAVFALFPATLLLLTDAPPVKRLRAATRFAGWGGLGAAPCLVAQAIHSAVMLRQERFFALTGEGAYLDLWRSRWADTLWSSWHGFFSWTPLAYIAFVAMFFYVKRNKRWAIAGIAILLVMAWVNGSTADWAGGWSFGGRRFTSVLVVLAPAFALLVHALVQRPLVTAGVLAAALIAWNQLLIAQYRTGMLTYDAAITYGQIVRQQAALVTRSPFFYPFAFPANAWFAWRTGLPIDRYDVLAYEPLRTTPIHVPMSRANGKFLLGGWGARVSDPFGELCWIDGDRAEMVLPLELPAEWPKPPDDDYLAIGIDARTRLLDPPQIATFAVRVNGMELGTFTPPAERQGHVLFAIPEGVLIRGFNRFVFERRGGTAPVAIYNLSIAKVIRN